MKRLMHVIIMCVFFFNVCQLFAQPSWQNLGLKGETVNCVSIDSDGQMLAGTNSGCFVYFIGHWYSIRSGLPVLDIIKDELGRIIVPLGNGSRSDGVYAGLPILDGPPFYSLSLIDWMRYPHALAYYPGDSLREFMIYAGSGGGISYAGPDTSLDGYSRLKPLKVPQYCFGVENPYCAAMQVFSGDRILYAGGYDRSPNPGPGSLCMLQKDSMVVLAKLNVTALVEGSTGLIVPPSPRPVIPTLYIGTVDDGIYVRDLISSSLVRKYAESPNNEMINAMIVLPGLMRNDILCVAVKSGVFIQSGKTWIKLGSLTTAPNCLAKVVSVTGINQYTLYAGTNDGVWMYEASSTAVGGADKTVIESNRLSIVKAHGGMYHVSFDVKTPGQIALEVLDCAGRRCATLYQRTFTVGSHSVVWNTAGMGAGVYFIRFSDRRNHTIKRVVVVQ